MYISKPCCRRKCKRSLISKGPRCQHFQLQGELHVVLWWVRFLPLAGQLLGSCWVPHDILLWSNIASIWLLLLCWNLAHHDEEPPFVNFSSSHAICTSGTHLRTKSTKLFVCGALARTPIQDTLGRLRAWQIRPSHSFGSWINLALGSCGCANDAVYTSCGSIELITGGVEGDTTKMAAKYPFPWACTFSLLKEILASSSIALSGLDLCDVDSSLRTILFKPTMTKDEMSGGVGTSRGSVSNSRFLFLSFFPLDGMAWLVRWKPIGEIVLHRSSIKDSWSAEDMCGLSVASAFYLSEVLYWVSKSCGHTIGHLWTRRVQRLLHYLVDPALDFVPLGHSKITADWQLVKGLSIRIMRGREYT